VWFSRCPAPVKNSRTEVAGDPDIFPRSVLDAPPLFSFQLPSTPSVPLCPPVGKWAGLTRCWAKTMTHNTFSKPIPILRSFDETKALEYYVEFLGFKVDWAHRFEDNTPLYMQLSLGETIIHISEHYGDSTPGSHMRIELNDVEAYCRELNAKKYRHARPGFQLMPWNTVDMTIADPFGNRITFYTRKG
jgi:uncharacterized glyoxalase superfamily protein PhnB